MKRDTIQEDSGDRRQRPPGIGVAGKYFRMFVFFWVFGEICEFLRVRSDCPVRAYVPGSFASTYGLTSSCVLGWVFARAYGLTSSCAGFWCLGDRVFACARMDVRVSFLYLEDRGSRAYVLASTCVRAGVHMFTIHLCLEDLGSACVRTGE